MNEVVTHLRTKDDVTQELGKMEQVFQRFGSSVKSQFAALGGVLAGAFAVSKIVAFGQSSVKAFAEAEEAEAKYVAMRKATNEATGISIEQMKELAASLQATTKQEDDHLISLGASLLRYNNLTEDVFPRVIRLAVDMAEVFGSVDNAANMLGRALNDPVSGMRILRMAGVELTDTLKDQLKTFQEAGDVAGAQNVIFKELEGRFAGMGEAMGETFSGKLAKLSNQFGDIKEMIGEGLIPAIEGVLPYLTRFATEFKAAMTGATDETRAATARQATPGFFGNLIGGTANLDLVMKEIMTNIIAGAESKSEGEGSFKRRLDAEGRVITDDVYEFFQHLVGTAAGMRAEGREEMARRMGVMPTESSQAADSAKRERDMEYERLFGLSGPGLPEMSEEAKKAREAFEKTEEEFAAWIAEEQTKWAEKVKSIEEEREKMRREAWDVPTKEGPEGFTATIESMMDVSRRIQTSLASRHENPEDKIIKVNRETTKEVVEKLDSAVEVMKPIAPKLDEVNTSLREMETGLA